ncbi:MAG: DUF1572 family protein [Pirellulales bacterium]|nr:DUF1572 family protein [Pirellulales bacterium]
MSEALDLATETLDAAAAAFAYHKLLADRAVAQLPDDALRQALDANTNSIAVVMKHVAGNLRSRWTDFLASDGEKPDRDRDGEFVDDYASRDELLADWERGWGALHDTLAALAPEDLGRTVTIRGEGFSVPAALARSLAHTAYHVGQIVQLARHWAGDEWETLTIPRGRSSQFNQQAWGARAYGTIPGDQQRQQQQ